MDDAITAAVADQIIKVVIALESTGLSRAAILAGLSLAIEIEREKDRRSPANDQLSDGPHRSIDL